MMMRKYGVLSYKFGVISHIQRAVDLLTVGVEQQEQNCKEPDGRAADVKVSC